MAQKAGRSDTPGSIGAKQVQTELSKLGEAQADAMIEVQKELLDTYEQISRAWLDGRRLFEDTQKIVDTMTRSLSAKWPTSTH
jgi:hypothetical protein